MKGLFMKVLEFKGKMSLKNKMLIIVAIIIGLFTIGITITYMVNEEAREWININILKKEISEEDVATIAIDADKTQYIYAYDKYIVILCNGKLEVYNNYGTKINELEIAISHPIFAKNGNYLAIAETDGQKIYLVSERKNTMGK
ncbi:MAG: hypothetical protein HFJ54_02745 [Clostridia bacterium]|nr:hypothetical protein [Clostridia bacterium]